MSAWLTDTAKLSRVSVSGPIAAFEKVVFIDGRTRHLDLFRRKPIGALWSISFRSKAVWESA